MQGRCIEIGFIDGFRSGRKVCLVTSGYSRGYLSIPALDGRRWGAPGAAQVLFIEEAELL